MMDQRQLSQDGGQTGGSEDQQPSDAMTVDSSVPIQTSNEQDDVPEDALLADEAAGWSAQFVVPFQQSGPLPAVNPQSARALSWQLFRKIRRLHCRKVARHRWFPCGPACAS